MRQELGLGSAERIERLEVWWPASDLRQVYEDIEMNTSIVLREGVSGVEVKPVRTLPLGSSDL